MPSGISPSPTTSSSRASRACATSRFEPAGPSTRMRAVGNSWRSASASATVATQSAGRARAERRARDVDGAVPVPVRLDDRPQLGALERVEQGRALRRSAPRSIGDLGAVHGR